MAKDTNIDPESWADEYGDSLYRYALSRLRDDASAQEMVQETFMAAFKGAKHFSGSSTEKTWLVGILKHKIVDYIPKTSGEQPYEDVTVAEGKIDDFFDRKESWKTGPSGWTVHPRKAFDLQGAQTNTT